MDLSELSNFVIEGDAKAAEQWTKQALSEGADPMTILNEGLVPAMAVVGEKFKSFEYYLPDLLVSAKAMKMATAHLKPLLSKREGATQGRALICTVKGDLHDIGKNLVGMMLEGSGFEIVDLGMDVSPEAILKAIQDKQPQVVCLSALLTTTMPMMKTIIDYLKEAGVRDQVKIMVGGAPITQSYASEIGADGYASEAVSAVERARELIAVTVRAQRPGA